MQLRDSSSRSATDGADQHTRCGKGEKKTIAPETNSSGQPAPDLEEVCGFSVSNKKFFFQKHPRFAAQTGSIPGTRTVRLRSVA